MSFIKSIDNHYCASACVTCGEHGAKTDELLPEFNLLETDRRCCLGAEVCYVGNSQPTLGPLIRAIAWAMKRPPQMVELVNCTDRSAQFDRVLCARLTNGGNSAQQPIDCSGCQRVEGLHAFRSEDGRPSPHATPALFTYRKSICAQWPFLLPGKL